jgi:Transposase DDE domain
MPWSGATGAIAKCKRVSTACGRKSRLGRVLRWICGVKLKPKAVTKPLQYFTLHELDKPGSSATVSKVIAIIDNTGYVLAPVPVAPVNKTDMVLLPEGLKALKNVAKEVGLDLKGAYLNLDGGFDSRHNRKWIFNAGMIPNIKENPRNRKTTKRGRKRFFNEAIHAWRMRVERTFAWEDKFKRLLLRFERIQQRHYGMKLMAYTLINLRKFCGT